MSLTNNRPPLQKITKTLDCVDITVNKRQTDSQPLIDHQNKHQQNSQESPQQSDQDEKTCEESRPPELKNGGISPTPSPTSILFDLMLTMVDQYEDEGTKFYTHDELKEIFHRPDLLIRGALQDGVKNGLIIKGMSAPDGWGVTTKGFNTIRQYCESDKINGGDKCGRTGK